MDGQSAVGAGDSVPRTGAARDELLSALMHERYGQPAWLPVKHSTLIAHRRRILLGKDRRNG